MENCKVVWEGNKEKHLSKNPLLRFLMRKFNQDVANLVVPHNPHVILDVGCGEGFTTRAVADSLPRTRITAIDAEKSYLEYAKVNSPRPNITYAQGDVFALKIPDNHPYDLVMANELLEHLEDFAQALDRLTRLSKRFVLVSVPNEPWFRIANFLRGKYVQNFGNTPGHINHWTRGELRRLVSGYGTVMSLKRSTFWNIVLFEPVRSKSPKATAGPRADRTSNGFERRHAAEPPFKSSSDSKYYQAFLK